MWMGGVATPVPVPEPPAPEPEPVPWPPCPSPLPAAVPVPLADWLPASTDGCAGVAFGRGRGGLGGDGAFVTPRLVGAVAPAGFRFRGGGAGGGRLTSNATRPGTLFSGTIPLDSDSRPRTSSALIAIAPAAP